MSSHYVGVNAGVVLGGTFTGFLAEAYGWRSGFWVLGVVGILVAMVGKAVVIDGPQRPTNERHKAAVTDGIKYLSRTPSYLILLTAAMMAGVALWIFFGWLPLYFQETFNLTMGAA